MADPAVSKMTKEPIVTDLAKVSGGASDQLEKVKGRGGRGRGWGGRGNGRAGHGRGRGDASAALKRAAAKSSTTGEKKDRSLSACRALMKCMTQSW
eukprot:7083999-Pyramimonas_sp.AAC.1